MPEEVKPTEEYVPISDRPSPVEVNVGAEMQEYINRREKELEVAEAESPQAETPKVEETPEVVVTPEPTPEPASGIMQRMLKKEASLRERKQALDEREKEHESGLTAWNEAKGQVEIDALAYLQSLDVSQETLDELAKQIYYMSVEDVNPDAAKAKAAYQSRAELGRLRKELNDFKTEQSNQTQQAGAQVKLDQYVGMLREHIPNIDTTKNPLAKAYLDREGEQVILEAMYNMAERNAQMGAESALTGEQAVEAIELELQKYQLSAPTPPEKAPEVPEPTPAPAPATLRNTHTQPLDIPYSKMTPDEVKEKARKAFRAELRARGMTTT